MLSGMNTATLVFAGMLIFQTMPRYQGPSMSSGLEGFVQALQVIQLQQTAELAELKARTERLEKVVEKLCKDAPNSFLSDCIGLGASRSTLRYPATAKDLSLFASGTVVTDLNA